MICPTRSSPLVERYGAAACLDDLSESTCVFELSAPGEAVDPNTLLAIDDCERLDDPDGRLADLIRRGGATTVFGAGRAEAMRLAFGHWTAVCRRSRLGLVMVAGGELDGDLLGAVLPRRTPIRRGPDWPG